MRCSLSLQRWHEDHRMGKNVRFALDEFLAGEFHDDAAVGRGGNEAVVLFRGDTGQRLEPMSIIGSAVRDRPVLHCRRYSIGNTDNVSFAELNETIRTADEDCHIRCCLGQRFIGAGMQAHSITIDGIPGNALGAYLNGTEIIVHGNAQDAVGDTMNDGKIVVHGSIGDAAGYAMRGGKIFVRGDAGYRAGIHMKEYAPENDPEKIPVMVIGGCAGSFLGEYQAGGDHSRSWSFRKRQTDPPVPGCTAEK